MGFHDLNVLKKYIFFVLILYCCSSSFLVSNTLFSSCLYEAPPFEKPSML